MKHSKCNWVRLGDYITQRREKNDSSDLPIYGVTRDGFIPPKQKEADTSKYNVFYLNDFVFNPARMEINSIYLNDFCSKAICSSLYEIFYINDTSILLPHFLHLFLKRNEFARLCEYIGWGSAREYCRVEDISEIMIPLPSPEEQQKVVNAWKALREIKEQNEAIAAPLMQVCQSYIQEFKHKYESVEIGTYIEESNERNLDEAYGVSSVRGLATSKGMIDTKANMEGVPVASYKIVKPGEIAFVPDTSRRGDKMSLGYNELNENVLVSSISCVIRIKNKEKLLPQFLYLWYCRPEFDRYARFNSWGSARETFSWEDFCDTPITLPSLEIQKHFASLYVAYSKCSFGTLTKDLCPILIKGSLQEL